MPPNRARSRRLFQRAVFPSSFRFPFFHFSLVFFFLLAYDVLVRPHGTEGVDASVLHCHLSLPLFQCVGRARHAALAPASPPPCRTFSFAPTPASGLPTRCWRLHPFWDLVALLAYL